MTGSLTRKLIVLMLLALGGAIVYVLSSAASGPGETRPFERFAKGPVAGLDFAYAGEMPETSKFLTPEGQEITLADLRGKVVLINFWATWCGPCEAEMPSLGALQAAFPKDQFEVIAVSVDNEEDKDHAPQPSTTRQSSPSPTTSARAASRPASSMTQRAPRSPAMPASWTGPRSRRLDLLRQWLGARPHTTC